MFIKVTNGVPTKYTIGELRRDNPKVSFPKSIPTDILANYNVYECVIEDIGDFNSSTHRVIDGDIEKVDGVWTQKKILEKREETKVASEMRRTRNRLLSETDWTQLPDAPSDSLDWESYRQALRDLTQQTGFPSDVEWPVSPDAPE